VAIGLTTLTGPGVASGWSPTRPVAGARADGSITGLSHRACVLWSRLSCNDFLMHRRAIARDDPTAAARATVGKGGRPVCCGRRGFWDGSQLRDGPVVAGPDVPLRRRHRPPGADETNTDLAKATATDGNTNDHDLGGSGAGAVAIGLTVGLGAPAWGFPGQLSLRPWPVSLPFPAPARQTVHAVVRLEIECAHQNAVGVADHVSQSRPTIPDGRISRVRF